MRAHVYTGIAGMALLGFEKNLIGICGKVMKMEEKTAR